MTENPQLTIKDAIDNLSPNKGRVSSKALDAKRFVNYSDKTKIIMENFKKKVLVYHIDKLQKEINEFNKQASLFKEEKDKIFYEFRIKKKKKLDKFLKEINPIIQEYMKKNSIDIVFKVECKLDL